MIKTIIQVSYLYGLLPLLIGVAFTCIMHRKSSSYLRREGVSYVLGYLIYLALFECIVLKESKKAAPYTLLVKDWERIVLGITVVSIICILMHIIHSCIRDFKSVKETLSLLSRNATKKPSINSRYLLVLRIISLFLLLLSVFLLIPHALDDTPELARLTIRNNSFFSIDPLTGQAYASNVILPGKFHLFFAFGSTITGINITTLIHRIIPVFMIPLFIITYTVISKLLFIDDKQIKKRFSFVGLAMLFYIIAIPFETHISVAAFRNIWNGTTFAASCLFPLMFSICLNVARHPKLKASSIPNIAVLSMPESIVSIICLSLAIHLCVPYGLSICGLFFLVSMIVFLSNVVILKRTQKRYAAAREGESL